MNRSKQKSRIGLWVVFLPIFTIIVAAIAGQYFLNEKESTDYQAEEKLMDYIGAEKVIERDFFYDAKVKVHNDTLYGIRSHDNYFFIQSLKDTSYFEAFRADTNQAPSYLYVEPGRLVYVQMTQFFYQESGCLYFGGRRQQIDKLCSDGSYEAILTEEAINKRKGAPRVRGLTHWKGKIIQTTRLRGGIFIFDKHTGEMLWNWHYGDKDYGGFTVVEDQLVFIYGPDDQGDTELISLNLKNLEKTWVKKISEEPSRGLETNHDDVVVFHGRTNKKTYFLDIDSGEIIHETEHNTPGGGSPRKFFSNIRDDYAFLIMDGGIAKYNFREGKVIWHWENTAMEFPYKDWVVLRNGSPANRYFVVDRKTGEGKIVSQFDYSYKPHLSLHDRYIQIGNKIYK